MQLQPPLETMGLTDAVLPGRLDEEYYEMEEATALLKEELSSRDKHIHRMILRKRELQDLLPNHGKLEQKDTQRTSTAPT